jgi:hypothetical protein
MTHEADHAPKSPLLATWRDADNEVFRQAGEKPLPLSELVDFFERRFAPTAVLIAWRSGRYD